MYLVFPSEEVASTKKNIFMEKRIHKRIEIDRPGKSHVLESYLQNRILNCMLIKCLKRMKCCSSRTIQSKSQTNFVQNLIYLTFQFNWFRALQDALHSNNQSLHRIIKRKCQMWFKTLPKIKEFAFPKYLTILVKTP